MTVAERNDIFLFTPLSVHMNKLMIIILVYFGIFYDEKFHIIISGGTRSTLNLIFQFDAVHKISTAIFQESNKIKYG